MRKWLAAVAIVYAAAALGAQTESPVREQREHELALVQHLRRHLRDPGDGLALAADRRDLQRMRAGALAAPAAATIVTGAPVSEAALLDALAVVADLWQARLNDRVPFGLMPRDRLSTLARAQEALGQLQSRSGRGDRDRFIPEMQMEVQALSRFAAGQGDANDQAIDVALRIADQAATGRPMVGPGPYPMMPTGPGYPPAAPGYPPGSYPGGPEGPPPQQGPYPGGAEAPPPQAYPPLPPAPPSGGPTPYELPPGYAGYAPSADNAAGSIGCQMLRQSAGASESVTDMLRAAECWSRQPVWPGWASQVHETLDWAATYARVDRQCEALDTVIEKIRELGARTAVAGLTVDMTALAQRAELDRRWMRSQNICR